MLNGQRVNIFHPLMNLGKLFLPSSLLNYYPPQFNLLNPIVHITKKAIKQQFQVGVIAFNIVNKKEIMNQVGHERDTFDLKLKSQLKQLVKKNVLKENFLFLHDHYGEELYLLIKINQDHTSVTDLDMLIKMLKKELRKNICLAYPGFRIEIETGYMFVEVNEFEPFEKSLFKAHQQALAMSEKRIESKYNVMVYHINKIIKNKDISLLAQPIIDVSTKEIKAWEILTRGPKGTSYESPVHLFSIASQTGLLYELELIVLEKALKLIVETNVKHDVFINFTPRTLGNHRFTRAVKKLLLKYPQIDPKRIIFEITERDEIEELEFFIANIRRLRSLGFQIAVDDTGAGYASLHTISEIMPEIIKIDRSVIQNIDTNAVKESMLKGLLLIAKETGSLVVAEGIEKEEEAAVLFRNNVDLAQGYFYAKPCTMVAAPI
ncbi:EAL domain-containing protein [Bacillus timonensis]|nr:EAL domain-containing protein [Bacillus timonensis]